MRTFSNTERPQVLDPAAYGIGLSVLSLTDILNHQTGPFRSRAAAQLSAGLGITAKQFPDWADNAIVPATGGTAVLRGIFETHGFEQQVRATLLRPEDLGRSLNQLVHDLLMTRQLSVFDISQVGPLPERLT